MIIKYFDNHNYDKNIIDKLLFNNLNYYYDNNNNNFYYLLNYPSYIYDNIDFEYNKIYTNLIDINKNSNINKLLKTKYPIIKLNRIIIIYNKKKENYTLIHHNDFKLNSNINILNFFIDSINIFNKDLNIIYNTINILNINIINANYFDTEIISNSINYVLINLFYYSNIIEQYKNILINNKNFDLTVINNNINIINEKINKYIDLCYNLRTSSLQKITYLEAGTSRLLTSIATIFLPLSFCIAFFSLPYKNIPYRNNDYGIYFIIIILVIIIFIIYYYYSVKFNNSLFFI